MGNQDPLAVGMKRPMIRHAPRKILEGLKGFQFERDHGRMPGVKRDHDSPRVGNPFARQENTVPSDAALLPKGPEAEGLTAFHRAETLFRLLLIQSLGKPGKIFPDDYFIFSQFEN